MGDLSEADSLALLQAKEEQFDILQRSQQALQDDKEALKAKLAQVSSDITNLQVELQSKDVRVSMLRHEVRVKSSLLDHLRAEKLWSSERGDEEVELLMEQAMLSPLAAIFAK